MEELIIRKEQVPENIEDLSRFVLIGRDKLTAVRAEMPKGNPKPQTIASEKYQKKAGYIVKGFKIKQDIAEAFADACEAAGVSQAGQITRLMREFVESQKSQESGK